MFKGIGKEEVNVSSTSEPMVEQLKKDLTDKYKEQVPKQWGEKVIGVVNVINTTDKVLALTFDACGGSAIGNGYDKELIYFLEKENVPATLFINYRWIEANHDIFMALSKIPIFEIENHGYQHKPISVNGKSVYGIKGTGSIGEAVEEVILNDLKIQKLTGKKPHYFRSGTAYYDEVAVKVALEISPYGS